MAKRATLKSRQKLGKYRIEQKLGEGGFAVVYRAMDTLEGIRVALKIPHDHLVCDELLHEFRHEVRLAARLKHPNILPLKNADFIDGRLVLVYPLGERSLAERLQSRLSLTTALDYADQMLAGTAHAHEHRIIHCDINPLNMLLFPDGGLKLCDFGIAKVALRTIRASGSGTVGFCAPEQAMGKPSFRSDVFSLGLVIYRMFSGELPEWPFAWPPPGFARLRSRVHPDMIKFLQRSINVDPRRRYADAGKMISAFHRFKPRALRPGRGGSPTTTASPAKAQHDWRTVRRRQFQRQFGKVLETRHECPQCAGPVSESMKHCPWCGISRAIHEGDSRFPQQCPRCHRGMKLDWSYCPWCYGPGFDRSSDREYADIRYAGRCANRDCTRKQLMPFMAYCPWCRRKVRRKWKVAGRVECCGDCGWGIVGEFWSYCPWCSKAIEGTR